MAEVLARINAAERPVILADIEIQRFGLQGELMRLVEGSNIPVAATILKAGHHGSRYSTGEAFVQAVNPAVAVIQVGENRYGHPTDETLARLAGRLILRNDRNGRIHVRTDGEKMWLMTERGKLPSEE